METVKIVCLFSYPIKLSELLHRSAPFTACLYCCCRAIAMSLGPKPLFSRPLSHCRQCAWNEKMTFSKTVLNLNSSLLCQSLSRYQQEIRKKGLLQSQQKTRGTLDNTFLSFRSNNLLYLKSTKKNYIVYSALIGEHYKFEKKTMSTSNINRKKQKQWL